MKYRSDAERRIHNGKLTHWGYESMKLKWVDSKGNEHTYSPDFIHPDKMRVIEVKGYFREGERTKYKAVKKQHKSIELMFAFQNPSRIIKGTKTSYSDWCKKNGFTCFSWNDLY